MSTYYREVDGCRNLLEITVKREGNIAYIPILYLTLWPKLRSFTLTGAEVSNLSLRSDQRLEYLELKKLDLKKLTPGQIRTLNLQIDNSYLLDGPAVAQKVVFKSFLGRWEILREGDRVTVIGKRRGQELLL